MVVPSDNFLSKIKMYKVTFGPETFYYLEDFVLFQIINDGNLGKFRHNVTKCLNSAILYKHWLN